MIKRLCTGAVAALIVCGAAGAKEHPRWRKFGRSAARVGYVLSQGCQGASQGLQNAQRNAPRTYFVNGTTTTGVLGPTYHTTGTITAF